MLESLVAQQFTERATEDNVRDLRRESDRLRAAYASHRLDDILDAKRRFYDCFCKGANNPVAFDILPRLPVRHSQPRPVPLPRLARHEQRISDGGALTAPPETGTPAGTERRGKDRERR